MMMLATPQRFIATTLLMLYICCVKSLPSKNFRLIKPIKPVCKMSLSGHIVDIIKEKPNIPSYNSLLAFGGPTLAIWLLQPILSLIDSSVVGMSLTSNIAELAAIGPGIVWIDSTTYLCQFIGMATTNLYAVALGEKDSKRSITVLSHATFLATLLGILLTIIQYTLSPLMISIISGTSTEIIPYGILYSKIRSFASLVAIPTIIVQSAFLTQKHVNTPLIATLIGAVVNIIGDIYLVTVLKQGIQGAAIATMLSQVFSFIYLIYVVWRGIRREYKRQYLSTTTSTTTTTTTAVTSDSTTTNDANGDISIQASDDNNNLIPSSTNEENKPIDTKGSTNTTPKTSFQTYLSSLIQIPSFKDTKQFASFSGPLFFILLAKSFFWSYTTYACSTSGASQLAAHQITINFFLFFAIFGDVTSQMSQTFLPSIIYRLSLITDKIKQITSKVIATNKEKEIQVMAEDENKLLILDKDNIKEDLRQLQTAQSVYRQAMNTIIDRLLNIGLFVGIVNSIVGYMLQTKGTRFFTNSKEVAHAMYSIRWLLCLCVLPHAFMASMEGVLVAGRDKVFHPLSYLFWGSLFLAQQTYVRMNGLGVLGVWQGFALFQLCRILTFSTRVLLKFIWNKQYQSQVDDVINTEENKADPVLV